nr:MAG TPA: hypothetical protein [Caudoviricetes sp.]
MEFETLEDLQEYIKETSCDNDFIVTKVTISKNPDRTDCGYLSFSAVLHDPWIKNKRVYVYYAN